MRYAKKIYKTQPKKQRRQMTSPNVIPAVRMREISHTREGKLEAAARHITEPGHDLFRATGHGPHPAKE